MKDRVRAEELLGTSDLRVRSAVTAWKHVHAEFVDIVDDILRTLAPSGPYAYTVTRTPSFPKQRTGRRFRTSASSRPSRTSSAATATCAG
ncbi:MULTISPECIES: hypothetical protein [unclassified Streptomyces]|uniref:hypothetical protein n=1 Tax=unclassified Streptomyces TaxID=2593676 RepID=UPI0036358A41